MAIQSPLPIEMQTELGKGVGVEPSAAMLHRTGLLASLTPQLTKLRTIRKRPG